MKILYSILWLFLIPFALMRLAILALRNPKYLQRFWQRLGWLPKLDTSVQRVWIHAVSVGETIATRNLVSQIQNIYPNIEIVMTTGTPTGADTVQRLYADGVRHFYQPYDHGMIVNSFLNCIRPTCLILMETELWPNLISHCYQKQVPVILVNARMSERSAKRYMRFESITKSMLRQIDHIAVQTSDDQARLISLGAEPDRVSVTGSIKFDLSISDDIQEKIQNLKLQGLTKRPIWIAASTHAGEEAIVIESQLELLKSMKDVLCILVPRHPERSKEILSLITPSDLVYQLWSETKTVNPETDILLVDTIGELLEFYAVADICFVGGSLSNNGGHNPLEPAGFSKPILVGPNDFNFLEIGKALITTQGALRIQNRGELTSQLQNLFQHPQHAKLIGANAHQYILQNRGSFDKVWNILRVYLD